MFLKDLKILCEERIENLSFNVASAIEKMICMGLMIFKIRQVDNNQPYGLEIFSCLRGKPTFYSLQ